ncbi:hypothetical protein NN561_013505 [Cricetulus griseus]
MCRTPCCAEVCACLVERGGLGKKKAVALFDSQAPICPICQVLLRPSELQEHMEQELEQLAQLPAGAPQARNAQGISHSLLVLSLLVTPHKSLINHDSQSTHTSRLSAHVLAYPCTPQCPRRPQHVHALRPWHALLPTGCLTAGQRDLHSK